MSTQRFGRLVVTFLVSAAFVIGVGGVAFAGKKDTPSLGRSLSITHKVLMTAGRVVKKGGEGRAVLSDAAMTQKAAKQAAKDKKPAIALKLTKEARGLARKAIEANGKTWSLVAGEKAADEAALAEVGAEVDAAEAASLVEAASQGAPPIDEIVDDPNLGATP